MNGNMTEYYAKQLKVGKEYQDFAAIELNKSGIIISLLTSEKYQRDYGESLAGIEIKFDGKTETTGNLYFETHEKIRKENTIWAESGILRKDNTWIYGIGNYKVLYLISKNSLLRLYNKQHKLYPHGKKTIDCYIERECGEGTSLGFTLPAEWVEKNMAAKVLRFEQSEKAAQEKNNE